MRDPNLIKEAKKINRAVRLLEKSQGLLFITGAGISAGYHGRPAIEINPDRTEISGPVDIKTNMGEAKALEAIWQRYQENRQERQ